MLPDCTLDISNLEIEAFELAKKGYMGGDYKKLLNLNFNEFNKLNDYEEFLVEMETRIKNLNQPDSEPKIKL